MLSLSFVEDQDSMKPSHSRAGADCYGRIRASSELEATKGHTTACKETLVYIVSAKV